MSLFSAIQVSHIPPRSFGETPVAHAIERDNVFAFELYHRLIDKYLYRRV
jgi:hypothetical protein